MNKIINFLFENLSPKQIVLKNAFWLYFSEGISKGFRFLVFLIIARILGPSQFGIFEYFLSFVGMFFLFADFGISNIFIRDYQQKEEKDKLISNVFFLKILFSIIFSIIALFGFFLTKKIDGFLIYLIFVIFYLLQNIENFFESYFIAVQKTEKKFIFNTISSLSLIIFIIVLITIYKNVFAVALAYLLSMLVGLLIAYLIFKKEAQFYWKIDTSFIKYLLFNGLPLALFGLLGYVFFSTDKIILTHLRTVEEVGYYSVASRIIAVLFLVPSLFNTALFPYLSRKVKEKHNLVYLFKILLLIFLIAGIFFSFLVYFLAPILINLFFGSKYLISISLLQIFSLILIFVFPTIFLDNFLISHNKQWLDFGLTIIPAILNIILNLILIPLYGIFGSVYASIISQALNFLITLIASILVLKKKIV